MNPTTTNAHPHCHAVTICNRDLIEGYIIEQVFRSLDLAAIDSCNRLVINFTNVERCSSSVLGKLIGLRRRILNAGGRLTLCGCGEQMNEAMKITGLRRLFDVVDDEEAAVKYMEEDVVAWKPGAEL